MKVRVIFLLFKGYDNNPNDVLNLFSCFCELEKDKLC